MQAGLRVGYDGLATGTQSMPALHVQVLSRVLIWVQLLKRQLGTIFERGHRGLFKDDGATRLHVRLLSRIQVLIILVDFNNRRLRILLGKGQVPNVLQRWALAIGFILV